MQGFTKYDSYRDSSVSWIGDIPSHWNERRVKTLSMVKRGASPRPIDDPIYFDEQGRWSWVRIADVSSSNKLLTKTKQTLSELGASKSVKIIPGQLFLSIAGSVGKPIISQIDCCIHDGFVYFPELEISSEFLYYVFLCPRVFDGLGKFGTQLNLNTETVGNVKLPLPPLSEQKRIAAFLDERTQDIDAAIAQKQRLIALLQEQKAILINNAVTKGLNPNVPMKDSGVAWIGEIPEHWDTERSKWLFTVRTERARPGDQQLSATQAYGVISQERFMELEGRRVTQITQHLDKRRHVEIDDFIISMRSFQGGLERAWESGCIRSSYVVLEPSKRINVDFFAYLFKSYDYIQALRATSNFIRDGQDLNFNNFSQVDLPVIPIEEQATIAAYLDQTTKDMTKTAGLMEQEIELLKEYRSILISEAVTGKIKV